MTSGPAANLPRQLGDGENSHCLWEEVAAQLHG